MSHQYTSIYNNSEDCPDNQDEIQEDTTSMEEKLEALDPEEEKFLATLSNEPNQ